MLGKIFASAGCGKTTRLLEHLDRVFDLGARPQDVLFTTFTRAGAYEARDRAMVKFGVDDENRFPYFRTLHSTAFRALAGPKIMTLRDYYTLGKELKCRFGTSLPSLDQPVKGKGDTLLALYNLQRNLRTSETLNPSRYGVTVSQQEYKHFIDSYEAYRNARGLYDYTDLMEEILVEEIHLPVQYAFIDEAQDLTRLQYDVVRCLAGNAKEIWYAGDDDQCIFSYSGADQDILLDMEVDEEETISKSYRLPREVSSYANEIAHRISKRSDKDVESGKDEDGEVTRSTNILSEIEQDQSTTILVRNRIFLTYYEAELQKAGLPYTFIKERGNTEPDKNDLAEVRKAILSWNILSDEPDKKIPQDDISRVLRYLPASLMKRPNRVAIRAMEPETCLNYKELVENYGLVAQGSWYDVMEEELPFSLISYMRVLEENGSLEKPPVIQLGTIHSFKGKEDEHVIVSPDMTQQTYQTYLDAPDQEHRVFFVAVTRSKKKLTLLHPLTSKFYLW